MLGSAVHSLSCLVSCAFPRLLNAVQSCTVNFDVPSLRYYVKSYNLSIRTAIVQQYIEARDKYNPKLLGKTIKFLLVGESPPKAGGYFYFEEATGLGNLFREIMKALKIPYGKLTVGSNKTPQLKEFQLQGFFLIDVSYTPVNKLSIAEKNRVLKGQIPRLVNDIRNLQPERIIILKTSLFAPVRLALEEDGFGERVLNKKPIPFPSNGWQATYRQLLQECIN